jgi:tetratricopeptide (TPR) repeat protein
VRAEGDDAVRAALEAARLFEEGSRHADAARAYRVALHSRPGAVPAPVLLAAEALAAGEAEAAARHLAAGAPSDLPESTRGAHPRKLARALDAAGLAEEAERAWREILVAAPADAEALSRVSELTGHSAASGPAPETPADTPAEEPFTFDAQAPDAEHAPAPPGWLQPPEPTPQPTSIAFASDVPPDQPSGPIVVEASAAAPAASDPQAMARDGRARMEQGDLAGAYDQLSLALAAEPSDLTVARDLSRVAEKLGLYDEYVQLGEVCADAIAAYDSLAAAARYRHFAQVLRDKVGAPDRAGVMLEKALALVPDDPDTRRELIGVWAGRPDSAPRALDAWLDLARKDPSDVTALAAVASLCEGIAAAGGDGAPRLVERGRLAGSIAAFMSPAHPPPAPAPLSVEIPLALRARVAAPGAVGPLARLLRLLAPSLETLFPADLRRRGASPEDRLDAQRAPAVAAALDGASRALRVRPFATFVSTRPGIEASIENTRPPSVIVGGGVAVLDDAALAFLAARTLDLLDHGWALVGKFAPKDVGILLELVCRFAGGAPPSLGLPPERAGAFLAVLESQVPSAARAQAAELGAAAAQELAETDPRALAAAFRRTANRVALLYAGDPGAALRILALLDRRLDAGALDPAQALALPDLRDLALFALSDPFLELRAAALGNIPPP